jgi:hypothetical protein
MGTCNGCGGKGHSAPRGFDHILGCGYTESADPGDPKWKKSSPFARDTQLGIIGLALQRTGLDKDQAQVLASHLQHILKEHSDNCLVGGKCNHRPT